MKRSTMLGVAAIAGALAIAAGAAAHEGKAGEKKDMGAHMGMGKVSADHVKQITAQWPEASRKAVTAMLEKYGPPDEVTASNLVWNDNGPWLRTIVYKEPVDHDFPVPHKDVLEQFIPYKIDAQWMDEITEYDGSVIAERTKGELSARCDREAANILALNLADRIFKGELSVEEARSTYAASIASMLRGEKPELMSKLQFSPPGKLAARDAGVTVLRARAAEEVDAPTGEKPKDQKQQKQQKQDQKQLKKEGRQY